MPQVIGCVSVMANGSNLEIGTLAVQPDLQGRGLGSKLLEAAERRARNKANITKIVVGVPSCRSDIIPFFTKRGYRVRDAIVLIVLW